MTISDCVFVIDVGIEKQMKYNAFTHISELKNSWISQAAANQVCHDKQSMDGSSEKEERDV